MHQSETIVKPDKTLLHKFRSAIQPSITPIGLHSVRFQSAILSGDLVHLALGCSLSVWDIRLNKNIHRSQTNTNTIFSMTRNQKYLYLIAYNGEIAIVRNETYELVRRVNSHLGHQTRYANVNSTHFVVTSEISQHAGCVHVYDIEGSLQYKLEGRYRFAHIFDTVLVVLKETKVPIGQKESLSKREYKKLKNNRKYRYSIEEYEGTTLMKTVDSQLGEASISLAAKSETHNFNAYLTLDRVLVVYDGAAGAIVYKGRFTGPGSILSMSFTGSELVLSAMKNTVTRIECATNLTLPETLGEVDNLPCMRVERHKHGLQNNPYFIKQEGQRLLTVNDEGWHVLEGGVEIFRKQFGGITFCGLSIDHDASHVFVGDFTGGVHGFCIKSCSMEHVYGTNVCMPIRSLVTMPRTPEVVFGTVTGSLYIWDRVSEPLLVTQLEGGITMLRATEYDGRVFVMASTTDGYCYIYRQEGTTLGQVQKFQAHVPQVDFDKEKFGSLASRAEVWSVAFHPSDPRMVATCSEDQEVHVYGDALASPKLLHVLRGHTLAVTSVDWQQMKAGTVLASCSDDQTIRLYDEEFGLLRTINTAWIQEWHTLTYMSLQAAGDLFVVVAQNGYVLVYSLRDDRFVFAENVHMGGVEGLAWRNNTICTCSSDNVVNVMRID